MNKLHNLFNRFRKAVIVLAILIVAGISSAFVDSYFEIGKNVDIFTTLYRELNTYYVDDIDPAKLIRTGIDAMVESLDPYTNYISESEVEDYRFMTTGQYGGIGATISVKDNYIVIREPYEGSPAQRAGLQGGDLLIEVDGKSVKDKSTTDVTKLLKGQPGTSVKVLIRRLGESKEKEFTITREEIKVKNVPYYGMVSPTLGYIQLRGFTQDAGEEVAKALKELKKESGLKGVVLDLRGNPGGLLHEAVNVSNVFIDKGQLVVTTKGKVKEWEKTYRTLNSPIDDNIELAILTSSGSASASEIVSGTTQDLDRGVIIGQKTFGKGLVQTTRPLTYNSQLKVTTAKYYIPSGRCIQALDYSHRNEDGSVGKVPDSLTKEFKTKNGRTVKDGGGVNPDFVLEPQPYSNIAISLLTKNLIFDFATLYHSKHDKIAPAREFKLKDEDYTDFVNFLSDKKYDYTTKSEKTLEDYKTSAKKEKYFDAIETEFEALKNKMMHDKNADLQKFKDEIVSLLEEEICSRYYYQKGRIEAGFKDDLELKKAIEVLSDSKVYNEALTKK